MIQIIEKENKIIQIENDDDLYLEIMQQGVIQMNIFIKF